MSLLNKITTGRKGRPQKVVISGPEGFGKSTLASRFPNPLFLDVEDSTSQLDVARLSREDLPTLKAFESALGEIIKAKPCETLVVDTMDWLEQMALEAIVAEAASDKIKGIEDFGYGKGYTIIKERITILLTKFDQVIASGIHVVLLAHSKVVKFEPPDGAGPYDRYELKLSKQVGPLVKEWADMFLFGNWRTQVREKDKNEAGAQFKGVGGRERLMHCNRTAAWDAKNRHGMGDVEKWEIDVIKKAFLSVNAPWGDAAPVATPAAAPVQEEKKPAAAPVAAPVVEAKPEAKDDEIPDIVNPPAKEEKPPVDAELARVCEPHAALVNEWLIANNKIKPGQDWRSVDKMLRDRITTKSDRFLSVVLKGKAAA